MPDPSRLHPRPAPCERTRGVRRGLLAASGALVLATGLGACGSSAASSSGGGAGAAGGAGATGPGGGPGRIFGAARDPKVAACLKQQGVTLPTAPRRPPTGGSVPYGGAGAGAPPAGVGVPPTGTGTPPAGARRFRRGAGGAQFQRLRKALAACGVSVPQAPAGAPGAPTGTAPAAPATPATTTGAATS